MCLNIAFWLKKGAFTPIFDIICSSNKILFKYDQRKKHGHFYLLVYRKGCFISGHAATRRVYKIFTIFMMNAEWRYPSVVALYDRVWVNLGLTCTWSCSLCVLYVAIWWDHPLLCLTLSSLRRGYFKTKLSGLERDKLKKFITCEWQTKRVPKIKWKSDIFLQRCACSGSPVNNIG